MLQDSAAICREIGARYQEAYALANLASVVQEEGEHTRALDLATQALSVRREIADAGGMGSSLTQIGELRSRDGVVNAAAESLVEAVDLFRQQAHEPELAHALALLANLPEGDAAAAEAALQEAGEAGDTPQTLYYLWKATQKHEHLAGAKRLLD